MSFQQGLSGLNAASRNLEVIGNNIANSGTYGAKASRAEFADIYATAMNSAGGQNIGIGVKLAAVTQQFTQGNIVTTNNPLDLAINGNGFFEVKDNSGQIFYSRNGQFQQDRNGYIVNSSGQQLMGYAADATGTIIPGQATTLQIPTASLAANATTQVKIEANLDSREAVPTSTTFDPADPKSYNQARTISVYDAQGNPQSLTYYFIKDSTANSWTVRAQLDGTDVPFDPADPTAVTQTLTFDSTGALTSPTAASTLALSTLTGATTLTDVSFDMTQLTQQAMTFGVTKQSQDGYSPGNISDITVDDRGMITANYSNGQSKSVGQVELASFLNPQGLRPLGGNAWARTYESGDPTTGVPGSGNLGGMESGSLEESNVDLTAELVNMMTAQRVYQANSQTIKTQDQMLQTLVSLR